MREKIMSHVVQMKTQFKDLVTLKRVCDKRGVGVELAEKGKTIARKLYQGMVHGVAALSLRGWRYPAMVQEDGTCKADNYNGSWGEQKEMDGLAHDYGVELATSTLRKQGFRLQTTKQVNEATELVFVS
jgi:hypothetical protein